MRLSIQPIAMLIGSLALFATQPALAQSKTYPDGHGGQVTFPQGDASFADAVVRADHGSEQPVKSARDSGQALGIPDYDAGDNDGYATLGCGGELVLKFTDNRLIDVAGPDLHVFEVGPAVESTALAVSADGEDWTRIGRIEGGKSKIDIGPYVGADQVFRHVKLVDLRSNCGGDTPGADIDAVGAIGSLRHIALDSSVLFASGKYKLKPQASAAIDAAVAGIDPSRLQSVTVAGYTDSVGGASDNQLLSQNRARSVADYLIAEAGFAGDKVHVEAHGENDPVADNATAAGRAKNRRVELAMRTAAAQTDQADGAADKITILGIWTADDRMTVLREVDGQVQGSYTRDEGRIRGSFTSDTVFEGYWIEKGSRRTCTASKDGSQHWGRLRIEFESAAHDAFDARWSYCDDQQWHDSWAHAQRIL